MALTLALFSPCSVFAGITLSNVLGDGMVLQRAPQQAVVWGFGDASTSVVATFGGKALPAAKVGADGVWRVKLPATPASKAPADVSFKGSDGSAASLKNVSAGCPQARS